MTAMILPPDKIETPRLLLRPLRDSDAEAIFAGYASSPEVTRYLSWPTHRSLADTKGFLDYAAAGWKSVKGEFCYGITVRAEGDRVIGTIGFRPQTEFRYEYGWVIAKPWWSQGIMTEAAGALIAWAQQNTNALRFQASCHVDNPGSAKVMEKLGMQREGLRRKYMIFPQISASAPQDEYIYAKVL